MLPPQEIETKELTASNEWKAHFKYVLESAEDVYTVKEDPIDLYQTKIEGDAKSGFTITNTYIEQVKTGIINLNINKYVEGTENTLANAKFKVTIKDSNGKVAYTKVVKTDKKGNIYIPGIELDLDTDYVLEVEETEAPAGYEKSTEKIKANFKLTKENDKITISLASDSDNLKLEGNEFVMKFKNKKMKEPEVLPQTGSNPIVIIAIIMGTVLLSIIFYVKNKKSKSRR